RGSEGGWQRQWCAWSAPALSRELLCSFRHWSGRAQHRSGLPQTRDLTLPSRGCPQAGFADLRPPLMSNVRPMRSRVVAAVVAAWLIASIAFGVSSWPPPDITGLVVYAPKPEYPPFALKHWFRGTGIF